MALKVLLTSLTFIQSDTANTRQKEKKQVVVPLLLQ